jgi:peptidoglycan-N-acetylglucosamine deacetylase
MTDRFACCLTFDFDGMCGWYGNGTVTNPSVISRGEFAAVAMPRILGLLKRHGVEASVAVPGHTALAFPDIVRRIRDEGHELVHHGWAHENPAEADLAGERRILEQGIEAIRRVSGVEVKGYRSPAWDLSPHTLSLLAEFGIRYDSSCMGGDFDPYYLRQGDQWSREHLYRFGELVDMVELPVYWGLDDWPHFEFVWNSTEGLRDPRAVEATWKAEFDHAAEHHPGGFFMLTFHPEVIGRGARLALLERLIHHFAERAEFTSMGRYVEDWRSRNPLELWAKANPLASGQGAITEMSPPPRAAWGRAREGVETKQL